MANGHSFRNYKLNHLNLFGCYKHNFNLDLLCKLFINETVCRAKLDRSIERERPNRSSHDQIGRQNGEHPQATCLEHLGIK